MDQKTIQLKNSINKLLRNRDYEKVIPELKKLIELNHDNISGTVTLAKVYEKINDKTNALKNYNKALNYFANKGLSSKSHEIDGNIKRLLGSDDESVEIIKNLEGNVAILSTVNLFSKLSANDLEFIKKRLEEVKFLQGSVVIEEGDIKHSMYIIKEGVLKVTVLTEDKKEHFLTKLKKGDFFGEIAMLTGKPRTATITTMTNSLLLKITKETFTEIAKKFPVVNETLLNYSISREAHTSFSKDYILKKRKNKRTNTDIPIQYYDDNSLESRSDQDELNGLAINISHGGACIEVDGRDLNFKNSIIIGKIISILIEHKELSSEKLRIDGKILWVQKPHDPIVIGFKYFIGVEFIYENEEKKSQVLKLIEKLN